MKINSKIVKFADPLKDTLAHLFNIDRKTLEYWKENVTINDNIIRQLMLNLGTDVVRYGSNEKKHNTINKYLNNEITKDEYHNKIFNDFMINIPFDNKLIFKDINSNEIIKEIDIEDFKKSFLSYMDNFIEANKDSLLSKTDTWSNMVLKNIPKDEKVNITDARFDAEFSTLFNNKDILKRSNFFLAVLLDKNQTSNTKNRKYIPMIKNQGKKIDPDILFNLYETSNSLDEFYNRLNKDLSIAPAEYINIAYTLNYFNEEIYKKKPTKLDLLIQDTPLYKKRIPIAFEKGINNDDMLNYKVIQNVLKDAIKQKNSIFIIFGPSENGKDYYIDLIDNLSIKTSQNGEIKFDSNFQPFYINPIIAMKPNGEKYLNKINTFLNKDILKDTVIKNNNINTIYKKKINAIFTLKSIGNVLKDAYKQIEKNR